MKLSQKQLRSLIENVLKEETRFEDVSGLAHDVDLYQTLGKLYMALEAKVGKGETQKWFRELVDDGVESTLSDYTSQDAMFGANLSNEGSEDVTSDEVQQWIETAGAEFLDVRADRSTVTRFREAMVRVFGEREYSEEAQQALYDAFPEIMEKQETM